MRKPSLLSFSLAVASTIIAVAARPGSDQHRGLSAWEEERCAHGSGQLCMTISNCTKLCSDNETCCESATFFYYYVLT